MRRVFAAVFGLLCLFALPARGGPPAEGSPAPALALRDYGDEGQAVTSQVFRDHVTLLSFFATWCEACKKEVRDLKRLQDRYGARGFQVLLVCLDIMGARNVGSYLEEGGGTGLRVATDKGGVTSSRYGVARLPTNVVVGGDGKVVISWDTSRPEKLAQVESYLSRLVVGPSAPGDRP